MSAATQRAHAVLSASTSKQWLNCPPSARLCETLPDTASEYAEEGRLAHAIAELRLRRHYDSIHQDAWPLPPALRCAGDADAIKASKRPAAAKTRKFRREMDKLKAHRLYKAEMDGYVDVYVDHVVQTALVLPHPPALDIETRLDFSAWVPQGFGTGDAILLTPGVLHIHDLKYGKGVPVKAEWNPQMMLYALGVITAYDFLYDVEEVRMSIVQPRRECISTWSISKAELLRWAEEELRPAAQLAWEGKGDFHPGQWCRFCRAAAICRTRAEAALRADTGHEEHPAAPLLTNGEIGPILRQAQDLARWVRQLEDYALDQCLRGNDIPGWRVAEGRSQRRLDLEHALPALVAQGYDESLFYRREPLPLGDMERIVGKARLAEMCEPYITWTEGRPILVPSPLSADLSSALSPNLSPGGGEVMLKIVPPPQGEGAGEGWAQE